MTNEQGKSTGALFGFIRSIQKTCKDFSFTHCVAVFDGPDNKKSRQTLYADYKSHRKKAPDDLYPQFEWAYEYCKLAGIPTLCVEGVEADDAMGAVAIFAKKLGKEAYLCSSDKDLLQLVGPHIFVLQAHKDNLIIDPPKVKELFGVRPDQIIDYLAIVGDASDNIPGLEGFGPKTAVSLLEEFDTLDHLLKHPEKVKGAKKQEILKTKKDDALMSRQLATIDIHVPIPNDLSFYKMKAPEEEALKEFYRKMHFLSLLKEKPAPQEISHCTYHLVDDEVSLQKLFQRLKNEKEVCIDTETTSLSFMEAQLVGIGFGVDSKDAWYIPCNGNLGKEKVIHALQIFFKNTHSSFFGHHLKYDWHVLQNIGISLNKISFDTLLASYLLNPQNRRHNLDQLTLEEFQKVKIPIDALIGKGKHEISMNDVPIEKVKDYCCEDIEYTIKLKTLFAKRIEEKHLKQLLYEIEIPLLLILGQMERDGIYLDVEKLETLKTVILEQIDKIKLEIFSEIGEEFNLNSPKQLSAILFDRLNMKVKGKKPSDGSTSADVLEELALDYPIADKILKYRGLEKLRSTYIEALPLSVNPQTHRIHCTFNQSVTATGRLSCQDPNLQNIPIRSKEGNIIRSCFIPEKKDYSYLGADYSQIELRLLAHFSNDPELIHAFLQGKDIHRYTASLVYDLPIEWITDEMRSAAKTVNFGIIYGQTSYGLSKQLKISLKDANDFIKRYFERYPKIGEYLEHSREIARKTGYATTLTGRQRPIAEMTNQNPSIRAAAERLAVNTPLQGTAADLIKMAMIEIDTAFKDKNLKTRMILQIHDELIFESPDEEIPIITPIVKEKMETVLKLKVPIEVHIAVGKNWAEC
jgi:DNA polymerase-1